MSVTHNVYRLRLPSGGVVRVRKPDRLAYLSRNVLLFPLLAAALDAAPKQGQFSAATPAEEAERGEATLVTSVCRAALVDHDMDADDLPYSDRVYLHNWALQPGVEPALLEPEPLRWGIRDLIPIVRTSSAILIDSMARRYGKLPSFVIGIDQEPELAFDFDLAIAYRGARMEAGDHPARTGAGQVSRQPTGDVEVEDVFGNKHTVPADLLPAVPNGASAYHIDDMFRRYGYCTVGVGGDQTGDFNVWH